MLDNFVKGAAVKLKYFLSQILFYFIFIAIAKERMYPVVLFYIIPFSSRERLRCGGNLCPDSIGHPMSSLVEFLKRN